MPLTGSKIRRIAVVGGGISGLAAAHRLVENSLQYGVAVELVLLEASSRLGGAFGTQQIGDYTIETGADSFITNKPWAVDLAKRLGIHDQLISPNPEFQRSLILHRGKTVVTPVGFNLLAPSRVWPMLTTPLLSPWGKLRMALEYLIPAREGTDDESLAAFVRRRFGQEMLDRIVQPMVGGIYTSDPEQLSLQATLSRFAELEREYGSLIKGLRRSARKESQSKSASGARYGLFATPEKGMSEFFIALEAAIKEHVEIRLNTPVASAVAGDSGWKIVLESGEALDVDGVVMALPAYRSAELIESSSPRLSELLHQIDYASSAIVVSGHRLEDVEHPLNAFGLVIPHRERRRILAVSFLSRKFPQRAPAGCVILRTFVGGAMQPEEIDRSDEEIIQTVRAELREILGVGGEPDFVELVRYPRAMPQYTVGHVGRVGQIQELARKFPNLGLAGNAYAGVGVPDCIHSGEKAAEAVWDFVITGGTVPAS